jgi:hypothetical protein
MTEFRITGPGAAGATLSVDNAGTAIVTLPDPAPAPAPAAAAAAAKEPLRIGFHPTPAEYPKWFAALPTPWFTRVFNPAGKGLPPWKSQAVTRLPAGTIPHVSWKDRVPASTIRTFCDSIPAAVPAVWLTWFHEGDIDWAGDVDGYTNYWKLVQAAVDDHPARMKITLVNVHTQYASNYKRSALDWRRFMLPDVADVDGWDCYRPASPDVYSAPEALLGLPLAAQREFGVRVHITEYGTHPAAGDTDGARQAEWYRTSCEIMASAGVEAVGFWCNADGQLEYRPTKPAVLAEWTSLMNRYNTV